MLIIFYLGVGGEAITGILRYDKYLCVYVNRLSRDSGNMWLKFLASCSTNCLM